LQRQADDLDAQYRKLTNERDRLVAELAANNLTQEDIDRDLHLRDDVMLGLQNPTPEIMMQAFEVIDLRVKVIEGDKVRLACRRPVDSRVIDINTPGGTAVSYTKFVPLAREIDLAAILFERAKQMVTI
jgi:hypothetical protein